MSHISPEEALKARIREKSEQRRQDSIQLERGESSVKERQERNAILAPDSFRQVKLEDYIHVFGR